MGTQKINQGGKEQTLTFHCGALFLQSWAEQNQKCAAVNLGLLLGSILSSVLYNIICHYAYSVHVKSLLLFNLTNVYQVLCYIGPCWVLSGAR